MPSTMGFDESFEDNCFKRKFRWLLQIPKVSASGINTLPPSKSARPNLTFKTMEIQHLNETIYRASKPDWKPISLILYDIKQNQHPVMEWIKKQYDPSSGNWLKPESNEWVISSVILELYDGCGGVLETWVYENVWIETADFGELDMSDSEVVTCDLTLRYDRAYIQDE
jgi:hypothetical protein